MSPFSTFQVGVRKTILDNIADLHRGRWGDRSLGAVTPVDRQRGIYLSAPDCVAIAFNSKTHARRVYFSERVLSFHRSNVSNVNIVY